MQKGLWKEQSRQRAKIGFCGLAIVLTLNFLGGVVRAESPRTMPAYVADVYNESASARAIVLRAARTREHMAGSLSVDPGGTARVTVQPYTWLCGTRVEVSLDGQPFQRLEGDADICQRNEIGDRPVIVIIENRVELTHVDVD